MVGPDGRRLWSRPELIDNRLRKLPDHSRRIHHRTGFCGQYHPLPRWYHNGARRTATANSDCRRLWHADHHIQLADICRRADGIDSTLERLGGQLGREYRNRRELECPGASADPLDRRIRSDLERHHLHHRWDYRQQLSQHCLLFDGTQRTADRLEYWTSPPAGPLSHHSRGRWKLAGSSRRKYFRCTRGTRSEHRYVLLENPSRWIAGTMANRPRNGPCSFRLRARMGRNRHGLCSRRRLRQHPRKYHNKRHPGTQRGTNRPRRAMVCISMARVRR